MLVVAQRLLEVLDCCVVVGVTDARDFTEAEEQVGRVATLR
jgi:hypothetical protein